MSFKITVYVFGNGAGRHWAYTAQWLLPEPEGYGRGLQSADVCWQTSTEFASERKLTRLELLQELSRSFELGEEVHPAHEWIDRELRKLGVKGYLS